MKKYQTQLHIPGLFKLYIKTTSKRTKILMQSQTSKIYTKDLPRTTQILKKFLPSIFNCECFNYNNHSFSEEVKNTELGHLFEHMLLEFLCLKKIEEGKRDAMFEGRTSWNWKKDKSGTFYIDINAGKNDFSIFNDALIKSITLVKAIVLNTQTGGQINHLLD